MKQGPAENVECRKRASMTQDIESLDIYYKTVIPSVLKEIKKNGINFKSKGKISKCTFSKFEKNQIFGIKE